AAEETEKADETEKTVVPAQTIAVRPEGRWMLVRYTSGGEARLRLTGFDRISDYALIDDHTLIVAEEGRDRLSVVGFDGRLVGEIRAHRPRCIQVLGPDRFLICQDDPARVSEIDRSGAVLW